MISEHEELARVDVTITLNWKEQAIKKANQVFVNGKLWID